MPMRLRMSSASRSWSLISESQGQVIISTSPHDSSVRWSITRLKFIPIPRTILVLTGIEGVDYEICQLPIFPSSPCDSFIALSG